MTQHNFHNDMFSVLRGREMSRTGGHDVELTKDHYTVKKWYQNQSPKDRYYRFHLPEVSKVIKFTETENRMLATSKWLWAERRCFKISLEFLLCIMQMICRFVVQTVSVALLNCTHNSWSFKNEFLHRYWSKVKGFPLKYKFYVNVS